MMAEVSVPPAGSAGGSNQPISPLSGRARYQSGQSVTRRRNCPATSDDMGQIPRQCSDPWRGTRSRQPPSAIRRYRRKGRARFLSDEEIRRLSARLSAHANVRPQQVAVIRLLLLTGCRKSEILTLRWSDYREGHLFLRDSKTGPRTVWLSQPARNVLDGLDRTGQWVFPAPRGPRAEEQGLVGRFLGKGPR